MGSVGRAVDPDSLVVTLASGMVYRVRVVDVDQWIFGTSELVLVHEHRRDEGSELYGFHAHEEREVFRVLLRQRGVGPAAALGILRHFGGLERLRLAATSLDGDAFAEVRGISGLRGGMIARALADWYMRR